MFVFLAANTLSALKVQPYSDVLAAVWLYLIGLMSGVHWGDAWSTKNDRADRAHDVSKSCPHACTLPQDSDRSISAFSLGANASTARNSTPSGVSFGFGSRDADLDDVFDR